MTDQIEEQPTEPTSADVLWEVAKEYHMKMADDLPNPADLLGVLAIIMTNSLVAAIMSGLPDHVALSLLDSIRDDVRNCIMTFGVAEGDSTAVN